MIHVYTDGGCTGNPGPGGWAAVIKDNDNLQEISGGEPATTNNRMELTAAIKALEALKKQGICTGITIHTDSEYVKNGITAWINNWKRNGWKTAAKKEVKNRDLWEALDMAVSDMSLTWQWVKGHSGVPLNERCDQLVARERERYSESY